MNIIIPSILEKTEEQAEARIRLIEQHAKVAQLDVLDHTFVPYRSFGDAEFIDKIKPVIQIEVHLMTSIDSEQLRRWDKPWVSKIIFHLKAVEDPAVVIEQIKQLGKLAGLALSPETTLLEAKPFIPLVDTVLIMGVHPGRSGQDLIPSTVDKVKRLKKLAPNVNIEFDGGVDPESVGSIARAGANLIISGSFLTPEKFSEHLQLLTELANSKSRANSAVELEA